MPSSRAASEILYVVRLFSFTSLRYSLPGYFGTGIRKGSQFRYWDSDAKTPEEHCTSAHIIVGCGTVTTDERLATPFALYLAIRGPAARIAEAPGARSSVGRAPPSHGGGQGFESPRVHSIFRRFAGKTCEVIDRPEGVPGRFTATKLWTTSTCHKQLDLR
jgi:hypothetical protein